MMKTFNLKYGTSVPVYKNVKNKIIKTILG